MQNRRRLKITSNCKLDEIDSFEGLDIRNEVLLRLRALNYPVKLAHKFALKLILAKHDLLLVSPPGSGRGSATMIGILNTLDLSLPRVQALVLCPTKFLAEEYLENLLLLYEGKLLTTLLCTAGKNIESFNAHVIVGTCGKILSLFRRGIDLSCLKVTVCDVANRLFKEPVVIDTEALLNKIVRPCVYWYLAPKSQHNIKEKFLASHSQGKIIEIPTDERAIEEVTFFAKVTDSREERDEFIESITYHSDRQVLIFSNISSDIDSTEELLERYSPTVLSSTYSKEHKQAIFKDFEQEVIKILICESKSSLLRRIKSKESVEVINLDIPKNNEVFLSRLRRFDFQAEDKVWFIITREQYDSLRDLTRELSLKIVLY